MKFTACLVGLIAVLLPSLSASAAVVAMVDLVNDTTVAAGGPLDTTFSSAITANALTIYTNSVADAYLANTSNSRYGNYGASTSAPGNGGGPQPVILKFDLSLLPGFVGGTINVAELRIYQNAGNTGTRAAGYITTHDWVAGTGTGGYPGTTDPSTGGVSFAHPIGFNTAALRNAENGTTAPLASWGPNSDSYFTYGTVAGNTAGGDGSNSATDSDGMVALKGSTNKYNVWSVTDIVSLWAAGTPNYGFVALNGNNWVYYTSDIATEAYRPVLFIDYTPAVTTPEPATLALLSLGGLLTVAGAARRRRRA
ncbi:MAG: hypothetical protein BIFFINMI_03050 [Phycisphaerae bacterium]|nr:hypothetical protein [Phycisphaerae bacterium]